MAQEWSRIVNTTINDYMKEREINILRNRKILALLKSRGRISMGHSGLLMDWKVTYKRAPIQGYADQDTLTFSRRDRWKTAQLDYRGYAATDSMTKLERLKNANAQAIVKVYSEIGVGLADDIEEQFGDEVYIDGNAAGNSKRLHGIESFLGSSGGITNSPCANPSDSYAGLNTDLGSYGGSWTASGGTTTWPTGTGDAHYDFWSPLLVDYTSSLATASGGWLATTKTWPNTCREALRFGIVKGKKNKSKKGMLDLVMMNDELYRQLEDKIETGERIIIKRGDKGGLLDLGFTDVINFEGVEHTYEYGVPVATAYGWAMDYVEMCSMQDKMFVPIGPDFDIASQSHRFSIDFFGNMRFNPRYFVKWKNYS